MPNNNMKYKKVYSSLRYDIHTQTDRLLNAHRKQRLNRKQHNLLQLLIESKTDSLLINALCRCMIMVAIRLILNTRLTQYL